MMELMGGRFGVGFGFGGSVRGIDCLRYGIGWDGFFLYFIWGFIVIVLEDINDLIGVFRMEKFEDFLIVNDYGMDYNQDLFINYYMRV